VDLVELRPKEKLSILMTSSDGARWR